MPGKDPIQVEYPRLAAKTMKLETQKDGETTLTINETLPFKDITVRDKYHITYITCVMIGLASLLPYTCLLSSSDYFQQHHSKVNNIILQMMTILNIFNFGSIALLIPFNKFISIYTRIYICSIMTAIIFITIFKYVDSYSFILGMSCLCGVSCGTLCTTVIAYAQFFSSKLCFNLIYISF